MFLFYVPCPDLSTAENIAKTLLNEKRVGCANILAKMDSHYWWQGQMEQSSEYVLLLKTLDHPGVRESLTKRIEELHPYDIPCVIILPVLGINDSYKKWLEDSMK